MTSGGLTECLHRVASSVTCLVLVLFVALPGGPAAAEEWQTHRIPVGTVRGSEMCLSYEQWLRAVDVDHDLHVADEQIEVLEEDNSRLRRDIAAESARAAEAEAIAVRQSQVLLGEFYNDRERRRRSVRRAVIAGSVGFIAGVAVTSAVVVGVLP